MTHATCSLTTKNRDQLRNPTLGDRVWAAFYCMKKTGKIHTANARLGVNVRRAMSHTLYTLRGVAIARNDVIYSAACRQRLSSAREAMILAAARCLPRHI